VNNTKCRNNIQTQNDLVLFKFFHDNDRHREADARCAFPFHLHIDETALADAPIVTFAKFLQHPLIDPLTGNFCFPVGQANIPTVSCRNDSLEQIMAVLVKLFFFEKIQVPENCLNSAARDKKRTHPSEFWAELRKSGFLGVNYKPPDAT
jgi:ubiquitin-protein ligase